MAGAVAGIELPEGDPGAVSDAARGLRGVAAGFGGTGQVTQRAVASVPSWEGAASINFQSRCGDYTDAAGAAQTACQTGSVALTRFAERLEEGRERVKRLQEEAEECLRRIAAADDRAAQAGDREASANQGAFEASFAPDAGASAVALRDQADRAAGERRQAEDEAQRARDELERLREKAREEREAVKEAADAAASEVTSAVAELPAVVWAGPFGGGSLLSPAQAQWIQMGRSQEAASEGEGDEEDDDNALEDAGDWLWNAGGDAAEFTKDQAVGFGTGVKEGVGGMVEGGAMLYRLSPTNALLNTDSFKQEWQNMGRAGQFAWDNPGEFGKALVNWEDLSEGRYSEWLGNLAPDAILALGTAGAGTAASRGLKGVDAVGDTADAARDVDRATPEGRGDTSVPGAPDGNLTDAGHDAVSRGDEVVRHWTPLDDNRPLVESQRGDTFRSSTYDEVRLAEDRLFYHDYSDPANRVRSPFWSREPSSGPFQSMLDNAILPEWGNRATETSVIRVPAGTTVFEGPAGPQGNLLGGANQTVIPKVDPSWEVAAP